MALPRTRRAAVPNRVDLDATLTRCIHEGAVEGEGTCAQGTELCPQNWVAAWGYTPDIPPRTDNEPTAAARTSCSTIWNRCVPKTTDIAQCLPQMRVQSEMKEHLLRRTLLEPTVWAHAGEHSVRGPSVHV